MIGVLEQKKGAGVPTLFVPEIIYSLRQINPDYVGNVLDVLRTSDNAIQSFEYVSGKIDTVGIATFCGASIGYARRIYSTGTFTAEEWDFRSLTGTGPMIWNGSAIVTINGEPALDFSVGNTYFQTTSKPFDILDENSIISTVYRTQAANNTIQGIFEERTNNSAQRVVQYSDTSSTNLLNSNYAPDGTNRTLDLLAKSDPSTNYITSQSKIGSDVESFLNGVLQDSVISTASFPTVTAFALGRQLAGNLFFNGLWSETVIQTTNVNSINRDTLINAQKTYYGIV